MNSKNASEKGLLCAAALGAALFWQGDAFAGVTGPGPNAVVWDGPGGNGHAYELITVRQTWDQASSSCESRAGHLATVASEGENVFIYDSFWADREGGDLWLGGFQEEGTDEPSADWEWVTGENWSYTNWGAGQPDNSNEQDCLQMWGGGDPGDWDDTQCDESQYSVCEWDTQPKPVPALPFWALGGLGILLGGAATLSLRRRNKDDR